MNLAATFVNGFVNTGFGIDKMMTEAEDASRWFYKNKEYGSFIDFIVNNIKYKAIYCREKLDLAYILEWFS